LLENTQKVALEKIESKKTILFASQQEFRWHVLQLDKLQEGLHAEREAQVIQYEEEAQKLNEEGIAELDAKFKQDEEEINFSPDLTEYDKQWKIYARQWTYDWDKWKLETENAHKEHQLGVQRNNITWLKNQWTQRLNESEKFLNQTFEVRLMELHVLEEESRERKEKELTKLQQRTARKAFYTFMIHEHEGSKLRALSQDLREDYEAQAERIESVNKERLEWLEGGKEALEALKKAHYEEFQSEKKQKELDELREQDIAARDAERIAAELKFEEDKREIIAAHQMDLRTRKKELKLCEREFRRHIHGLEKARLRALDERKKQVGRLHRQLEAQAGKIRKLQQAFDGRKKKLKELREELERREEEMSKLHEAAHVNWALGTRGLRELRKKKKWDRDSALERMNRTKDAAHRRWESETKPRERNNAWKVAEWNKVEYLRDAYEEGLENGYWALDAEQQYEDARMSIAKDLICPPEVDTEGEEDGRFEFPFEETCEGATVYARWIRRQIMKKAEIEKAKTQAESMWGIFF